MKRTAKRATALILAGAIALLAKPVIAGDPELVYHTLHTPHFRIHYHQGLETMAQRLVSISEAVHTTITRDMGWVVHGPTQVVLTDFTDSANGLAQTSPSPRIILYASPPDIDSSLQYHDDWLYTLFMHEYTHIVHIQMQYGVSRAVNSLFGDIYLPNSILPTWLIEGMAILNETHYTSRGRMRSPYYHMILRTHALEDALQTLGEASHTTTPFPRGTADYAYGAMFMDYLRTRFSNQELYRIGHLYAASPLPYGVNRVFKQALGDDLITLYRAFTESVRTEAESIAARIHATGFTPSSAITHTTESVGIPIFDSDNDTVLVSMKFTSRRSGIYRVSLTDGTTTRLVESPPGAALSIGNSGTLYYNRRAPYKNHYRFSDLFKIDARGTPRSHTAPDRLTHGARVRGASIAANEQTGLMVTQDNGQTALRVLDMASESQVLLRPIRDNIHYYAPTLRSDGLVGAVVVRRGHQVDLALVNPLNGHLTFLTDDIAIEQAPAFSPDGKTLFYASDRTGILNIYAIDLQTKTRRQITNVVTGATNPAVSPDGKTLVFAYYRAQGWALHQMPLDIHAVDSSSDPVVPTQTLHRNIPKMPPPEKTMLTNYNPLPSLRPKAWRLTYENGRDYHYLTASMNLNDAVDLHRLNTAFSFEFANNMPSVALHYHFLGLRPNFTLQFSYSTTRRESGYLVGGHPAPWHRRTLQSSIGLGQPLLRLDDHHHIGFSYTFRHMRPLTDLKVIVDPNSDLPQLPSEYFRAGIRFSWSYSDVFTSPFAISTEDGRRLSASVTMYHPIFGGHQELVQVMASWREYIMAPWRDHDIFALSFSSGAYIGNPMGQAAFSAGGYSDQDYLNALIEERFAGVPRIRGYESNAIRGDHFIGFRGEYRFLVWRPELAYQTLPLLFKQLHAGVFMDNIVMGVGVFDWTQDYYSSVGGELIWTLVGGYHRPFQLRTGFARGLQTTGINEFIMVLGGAF